MDPTATEAGAEAGAPRSLPTPALCRSPSIPRAAPGAVFTRPFVGKRNRASQGHSEGGGRIWTWVPPSPVLGATLQPSLWVSTALARPPDQAWPQSHQDTLAWPAQHRWTQQTRGKSPNPTQLDRREPTPVMGTNPEATWLLTHMEEAQCSGHPLSSRRAHSDRLWQVPAALFRVGGERTGGTSGARRSQTGSQLVDYTRKSTGRARLELGPGRVQDLHDPGDDPHGVSMGAGLALEPERGADPTLSLSPVGAGLGGASDRVSGEQAVKRTGVSTRLGPCAWPGPSLPGQGDAAQPWGLPKVQRKASIRGLRG